MDILDIDTLLANIEKQVNIIYFLRPLNLEEERKRFFRTQTNPQFYYRQPLNRFHDPLKKLQRLSIPQDTVIGYLLRKKQRELIQKILLIHSIGKDTFTQQSIDLFGTPDSEFLQIAQNELQQKPHHNSSELPSSVITSSEVKKVLRETLQLHGIHDNIIRIIPGTVSTFGFITKNLMYVRDGLRLPRSQIQKSIIHEITHLLRLKNGEHQPYHIFQHGFAGYIKTEEGLASYNEKRHTLIKNEASFLPALYAAGCFFAQHNSFVDTFRRLRAYGFSEETSWTTTVKIKRGLIDTSRHGGFTKDHLYLKGRLEIEAYLSNQGVLNDLYLGKVALEDMRLLQEIPGITKPKFHLKPKQINTLLAHRLAV